MVDGRAFYYDLDTNLNAYSEMWNFIKSEFSSDSNAAKTSNCCTNAEIKNYELNPEIKEDLESVKGMASGFSNQGNSAHSYSD